MKELNEKEMKSIDGGKSKTKTHSKKVSVGKSHTINLNNYSDNKAIVGGSAKYLSGTSYLSSKSITDTTATFKMKKTAVGKKFVIQFKTMKGTITHKLTVTGKK